MTIRRTEVASPQPVVVFRAGLGGCVPRGYIRIGVATSLPDVLRDFGIAPETLFRNEGIPIDLFDDSENTIPYVSFCNLLSRCVSETCRDDLSLLIFERVGASALGLVGFLLQQAPDVRTAVSELVRYLHHSDCGAVPSLRIHEGMVSLGYSIYEPNMPACEQIYDAALAIGRNIMRGLCGPRWTPAEITLSRRQPSSRARYERFFAAPVRFEAEHSAILFAETWLDAKLPNADPALRRMLQEQVDLLETEESVNMAEQVRRLLRTVLRTHSGSVDDVSKLLQMTRRTLARRLEAEGATFKQLSDEIQFEIARQLLLNTSLNITGIALALNYSEASAFTRAFRQWSGLTPREWRQQHIG